MTKDIKPLPSLGGKGTDISAKAATENRLRANRVRGATSKDPVDKNLSKRAYREMRETKNRVAKELESYKNFPTYAQPNPTKKTKGVPK